MFEFAEKQADAGVRKIHGKARKEQSVNIPAYHLGALQKQTPGAGIIQFCGRPQRTPTMYTLIYGGQGPHTVPFAVIDEICQNCSAEDLRGKVLTPGQFKKCMDDEEIFDYDTDLDTYTKIYNAFLRTMRIGKEIGVQEHIGCWGELGWRQLGSRLINLNPYATFHWRSPIDYGSKEGHNMISGKGVEHKAASELRKEHFISLDTAWDMIDGMGASDNQYISQDGFQKYILDMVVPLLREEDRSSFITQLKSFFSS